MVFRFRRDKVFEALKFLLGRLPDGDISSLWLEEAFSDLLDELRRTGEADPEAAEGPVRASSEASATSWISLIEDWEVEEDHVAASSTLPQLSAERYQLRTVVGVGGQGVVHEVVDRYLGRCLALKVLRPELVGDSKAELSFLREARILAQLSHAGIVAVHDIGIMAQGAPAYTMKRVRGRSLREVLFALRAASRGDASDAEQGLACVFPRRRLLEILMAVAHIVGYAHDRGVVHRDIKPGNVMIGDYGEVFVLDWGIARLMKVEQGGLDEGPVELGTDDTEVTSMGTVKGTPSYMAPEQAKGEVDAQGPWSDVFALGLVLFEILCGEPARAFGDSDRVLIRAREEAVGSPEERRLADKLPAPPIPAELEAVCMKCLAVEPTHRYPDGESVARGLQAYLDGEQRREQAEAKAREAEKKVRQLASLSEEVELAKRETELLRDVVDPWMDIERKRLVWEKEDKVKAARALADLTSAESFALYMQALGDDPENSRARNGLARLYFDSLKEAEAWGRLGEARRCEAQIRTLDDGTFAEALRGDGALTLTTDPPGAEVWLYTVGETDRRLLPGENRFLGRSPISCRLPMGRYLAIVRWSEGGEGSVVNYPVLIRRQERVEGVARRYENIPGSFVLVPEGRFISGGDRHAPGAKPMEECNVNDFAIAQFPVTSEEYLEFLVALDEREPGMAEGRVPRVAGKRGSEPLWPRTRSGYRIPRIDAHGARWEREMPVRCVSRDDAEEYCRWRSRKEGVAFRLPSELEWEKAGRGVDGRFFPWGDSFDASFCKMKDSRPGPPEPEPVGAFPDDCSPYGVRDLAGGVIEWCSGAFDSHGVLGIEKGGFWMASESSCRLARRFGVFPSEPEPFGGFRLAFTPVR